MDIQADIIGPGKLTILSLLLSQGQTGDKIKINQDKFLTSLFYAVQNTHHFTEEFSGVNWSSTTIFLTNHRKDTF